MPGIKVFDVYGELHLDRETARDALRGLPGALGPDADRAGKDLGERLTRGLAEKVEQLSGRVTKARREESKATDAVKLAELRLSEAREKGNTKGSVLLGLTQRLTQAQHRLTDAQKDAEVAVRKHADAERRLADDLANVGRKLGPDAERSGREIGGKLSQGIHLSIVRNSPLIVAGIGAALAAGAPVALAGATALFGGIGIVAAAQSDEVQSAWLGTWHHIRDGAIDDASVIEPVLVGMADRVGDGFDRMRPRLQDAFTAAAPQIEVFSDGIIGLAENALPGLVRAVEQGMPVTQGFASFLEKTGTGISDFFDGISSHAPAAGQALDGIGDIVGVVLPLAAEFLGQGAELAADVLPALSGSMSVLLTVTQALGPALPLVGKGLLALSVARTASGWLTSLGGQLDSLAVKGGLAEAGTSRFATSMGRVGSALPIIGLAVVGVTEAMTAEGDAVDKLAGGFGTLWDKVRQGGAAADEARAQIEQIEEKLRTLDTAFGDNDVARQAFEKARDAARGYWESLTPVEQAQSKVAEWTRTLASRLDDEDASAEEVEAAHRRLAFWTGELETEQSDLQMALHGVTQAMIDQANQALAGIDSSFAYRNSLDQLEDAQLAVKEAMESGTVEEQQRAMLALEEANYRVAQSYGQQQADLSGLSADSEEYARLIQTETLRELYRLRDAAGPQMAAAIQQQINMLEAGGVSLNESSAQAAALAGKMRDLGLSVQQVPGQKFVKIDAPTAAQQAQIEALGYKVVHLPDGSVYVVADTSGAYAALNAFIAYRAVKSIPLIGNFVNADGGMVGLSGPGFAAGGVFGPGGPRDDMVPAVGPGGARYRLSDGEHILDAFDVDLMGGQGNVYRFRDLLNKGRINIPGLLGQAQQQTTAAPLAAAAPPMAFTPNGPVAASGGRGGGATISIGELHLHIEGTFDLASSRDLRRAALTLRQKLLELDRETS